MQLCIDHLLIRSVNQLQQKVGLLDWLLIIDHTFSHMYMQPLFNLVFMKCWNPYLTGLGVVIVV